MAGPVGVAGHKPGEFSATVVDYLRAARLMREAAGDARLLAGRRARPEEVAAVRLRYAGFHAACVADVRRARRFAAVLPG